MAAKLRKFTGVWVIKSYKDQISAAFY